ncbi:Beta-ketoadipate enol-lactone hydrolase [Actinokineospora spheciospongiae]|uniref:Beta-ketoadipate enol-lactone hydrolase n=1 Tax=Actinokineospora spheciospongiae TaxID=909613 RepID=W7IKC1_9PSEU|nr:alpha/beta hydrolase [Actinokineospora spheciospongiae]EWC61305.1 Beta-ketoadipate enol-lactone hydrolase [Actinokineospora spheciospongiae]
MTARAAVADVAPLLLALDPPQRAALPAAAAPVLSALTDTLGLPGVSVVPDVTGLSAAELVITARLSRVDWSEPVGAVEPLPVPTVVPAADGVPLRCHLSGPADGPPVVVVSACGMPVGLISRWLDRLSREHRVLTWDSRGLFTPEFDDGATGVDTQAADLLTLLDAHGMTGAHLVGLCGGAPIALAAAARTDRVGSLSLWHGDYELGEAAPKTAHQRDVQALMTMAGRSRAKAASLHGLFRRPQALATLRADIAHHLYYPYATPELLYRYGALNGAIMTTDCRPLAAAAAQPTLVVTSGADTTAHPAGSRYVAAALPNAALVEFPTGDHLSAFDAGEDLLTLATGFIADPDPRRHSDQTDPEPR